MPLPCPADTPTLHRLNLARRVWRLGVRLHETSSADGHRLTVLIQYDFAIEGVLKALVLHLGQTKDMRKLRFPDLIGVVDDTLTQMDGKLVGRAHVTRLHDARNAAQHEAHVPTAAELAEYRVHAHDFLIDLCGQAWGLRFDDVGLDLIQSSAVKQYLEPATTALAEGKHDTAVAWARGAIDTALRSVSDHLFGNGLGLSVSRNHGAGPLKPVVEALVASHERASQMATFALMGLDPAEYFGFRTRIADGPALTIGGTVAEREPGAQFSIDQAEYALTYVIDAIVGIEAVVGDIDRPFGMSRPTPYTGRIF